MSYKTEDGGNDEEYSVEQTLVRTTQTQDRGWRVVTVRGPVCELGTVETEEWTFLPSLLPWTGVLTTFLLYSIVHSSQILDHGQSIYNGK